MLRREALALNHKRTDRLYIEQGLQVRTKKRRKLPRRDCVAPTVPERPMQRRSLDFTRDQLAVSRGRTRPKLKPPNFSRTSIEERVQQGAEDINEMLRQIEGCRRGAAFEYLTLDQATA